MSTTARAILAATCVCVTAFSAHALPSSKPSDDGWGDYEKRNGCMTVRQEVLAARSLVRPDIQNCAVVTGRWHDAWTGEIITDARMTDLDRVITLQKAFESGASSWSTQSRHAFFNDAENLVVIVRESQTPRGNLGPDAWLPEDPGRRCDYVRRWVQVKRKWQLTMDADEIAAVRGVLAACPAGSAEPSRAETPPAVTGDDLYTAGGTAAPPSPSRRSAGPRQDRRP